LFPPALLTIRRRTLRRSHLLRKTGVHPKMLYASKPQ
jgi:hypothetical protein